MEASWWGEGTVEEVTVGAVRPCVGRREPELRSIGRLSNSLCQVVLAGMGLTSRTIRLRFRAFEVSGGGGQQELLVGATQASQAHAVQIVVVLHAGEHALDAAA